MWWWIGSVAALLGSLVWILYVATDGIRRRASFVAPLMVLPYGFHLAFGVLGIWLMLRAVGS